MGRQAERASGDHFTYAFKFLARSEPHGGDNEPSVTVSVAAGRDDHLVYCGVLTMSEAEWDALRDHLEHGPRKDVEVEVTDSPSVS